MSALNRLDLSRSDKFDFNTVSISYKSPILHFLITNEDDRCLAFFKIKLLRLSVVVYGCNLATMSRRVNELHNG